MKIRELNGFNEKRLFGCFDGTTESGESPFPESDQQLFNKLRLTVISLALGNVKKPFLNEQQHSRFTVHNTWHSFTN